MTWTAAYYAFFASPLSLWLINRFLLRNKIHWLLLWPIAAFACYFFLLLGVHLLDSQLLAELNQHDLDGNGSFSDSEDSPAMREALGRVTNDTGRALAPVTGILDEIIHKMASDESHFEPLSPFDAELKVNAMSSVTMARGKDFLDRVVAGSLAERE